MLLRKENIQKVGAGQPHTWSWSYRRRPPTIPAGRLEPQLQVGHPVGEHPVDANISTILQKLLQDLAKESGPHCVQPIYQFSVKHGLSK